MAEPRRLLLLITSLGRGGAERQIVDLTTRFRRRGWAVAIVSMVTPTDHLDALRAAGAEVLSLDMRRARPTVSGFLRYLRFVRRWRPDVVHSHMVHANLLARIGRIFHPSVPVVGTVHNVNEGARWREIAYRLTDRMASQTTAVSSVISDRYVEVRAVPSGRIITVPNGIDMADETVVTAARLAAREAVGGAAGFVWICVGRLVPEKGQSMLVEALAQVRKGHPEARLAIVGDGPERPRVERVVASLGLGGAVYVLGQRDDVAALLAVADAFVMASRWEGLPMVLLEAAAQGLPIVATDVGGNRDIARPELGAILCEPTVLSLSQSMTSMLESEPDARARIGRALRANVQEKFDLDRVVDQWERIYATAIQGSGH